MTESQHYTDIDISDVIDDTEQYADTEQYIDTEINSEPIESEILQESELVSSEEHVEKKPQSARSEVVKATRLPIARIKNIMKQDPDVSVISADAAFLVTKATIFASHLRLHGREAGQVINMADQSGQLILLDTRPNIS
ncbi:DNA polymerase epsilon subunit 4 isoform X2 [Cydia pomonella]|uniref:DNA polymerase epsilon subunit 4 isoform X2 n=1 Tax=Cydia pomonella TaxID=82600 RepID=UPI002ADE89C9|nr:DNA polymerase epsilon subunit 4 isoform X2 [Cydia pomonella]